MKRRDTRARFERWARNPQCDANAKAAVLGVSMASVAKREGLEPTTGQSPFALARGQTFERRLFRDDAEQLRLALVEAGVLPAAARGFLDLRTRKNGGSLASLDVALERTTDFFRAAAAGESVPAIVAGPTIRVPGRAMLPEAILVVDALAVLGGEPAMLVVGEVKTYPDRSGYTDRSELASARAQAGVYVHGLESVIDELGLAPSLAVSKTGFLVLSRAGVNVPSVRAGEDLAQQAERARRGLERLRAFAAELARREKEGADPVDQVLAAKTSYREECLAFCDRAQGCWRQALAAGEPVVLGSDVERFLGTVKLGRALELMAGAPPTSDSERDVLRRFDEGGRS